MLMEVADCSGQGDDEGSASGSPSPAAVPPAGGARETSREDAAQRIAALEAENAALRAEAERLRQVLDSATDHAIVTLNPEGRITGWNEGARAILGYGDAEILGRSGEVFFPAEDRAGGVFVGELCRALEEGRAPNERWHIRHDGSRFWASGAMLPLLDGNGQPDGFLNILRDNSAVRAAEERRALLLAEMGHRVKNTLATVQSIAMQTLHDARVPEDVKSTFTGRLIALAHSHNLLIRGGWEGALLPEVVARALSPYGGSRGGPGDGRGDGLGISTSRVRAGGPPVRLPTNAVEMLGLAFHELATNAAKYGALSVPEGRIEVQWSLARARSGTRLVEIVWRELGGPPVVPPARRGFGSRLLERGLTHDLGSTVKLDFRPEGLECHICLPVAPATGGE